MDAMGLSEVKLSNYSAMVFVGGEGVYELKLYEDADYQNLAKSIISDGKVVGAIYLGHWILANAGRLEGKAATTSEIDYLQEIGAKASDQSVTQGGKIVIGSGSSTSQEFAEKVV
jgi:putative intracellular protease/amidase